MHELFILFLADEFAVGEQFGAKLAVFEIFAELVVAGMQAQAMGFRNQSFFIDELLRRLTGKKRHQHACLGSRVLALDHGARFALDFSYGHFLIADRGQYARARAPEANTRPETAGNQCNDHAATDDDEDAAENDFEGRPGVLQLSNHNFWLLQA